MQLPTSILIASGIIVVTGLSIFLVSCKNASRNSAAAQTSANTNTTAKKKNPYEDLRIMALHATAAQLNISVSSDEEVYAVVMDGDLGDATMTLVSFKTGDASIYLSTGGGFMGGGQSHKTIADAAKAFVAKSQKYIAIATPTVTTPLPDKGCTRFYLLTTKGIFSTQAKLQDLESGTSDWAPLFEAANGVITEYRIVNQAKQ